MFELFICNAVVHVALVPSILVLNYLLMPGASASRARCCQSAYVEFIVENPRSGFVCLLLQGLGATIPGAGVGGVSVKSRHDLAHLWRLPD